MTDAPLSAASIAAGSPAAPAPTTTISACLSQCGGRPCASACSTPSPLRAAAPTPAPAVFTKSRRVNRFLPSGLRGMPDLPIALQALLFGPDKQFRLDLSDSQYP